MAGQSRIVGRISTIAYSSSNADSEAEFIIQYHCTGPVTGQTNGEAVFVVDVTQAEAQINAALRAALAAYVTPLVYPPQGYAANDVRGCNL